MSLIKSNIYKWHRSFSLVIAIPVLLWAASGFMHPLMTNIRPKIATQGLNPIPVDSSKIRVPLQAALRLHHLDSIANFRLVHIDTNWFYQVVPATHHANPAAPNSAGHSSIDASSNKLSHPSIDAGVNIPGGPIADYAANIPIYLSCLNGNVLPAGDWLYAQYLARQFLEGTDPAFNPASSSDPTSRLSSDSASAPAQPDTPTNHSPASTHQHSRLAPGSSAQTGNHSAGHPPAAPAAHPATSSPASLSIGYTPPSAHDCCGAATDCVLNPVKGAKVANVSLLKDYDPEYKSINKLLPVYRVSFNRPDGIRVYVETTRDRFAFAMDNRRFVFDRLFTLLHTWGWLDFLGKGKLVVEFTLVSMAFLTTLMGIYIFFTTKSKKGNGNKVAKARRTHRFTAITIALFTLLFTFSGAFHALSKFREDIRDRFFVSPSFASADLNFNFTQLQQAVAAPITDIRIVHMSDGNYWQITTIASSPASRQSTSSGTPSPQQAPSRPNSGQSSSSSQASPQQASPQPNSGQSPPVSSQPASIMSSPDTHSRDLMKDPQAAAPVTYIRTDSSYSILPEGEQKYARLLAATFSGQPLENSQTPVPVLRFSSEYNFADKRLPVWKVSFPTPDNQRYYVETSTGRLAKLVNDNSMIEEYSFAFFHKHEFMGWGGKGLKDFSTMFWALAQIAMVVIGLMLYFKGRLSSRKKSSKAVRTSPMHD